MKQARFDDEAYARKIRRMITTKEAEDRKAEARVAPPSWRFARAFQGKMPLPKRNKAG